MKRANVRIAEVLGSVVVALLVSAVLVLGFVFGLPERYKPNVPRTTTHDGSSLSGKFLPNYNQEVWYGIQYAQPPTGKLRFAGPEPIQGTSTWRGGLDASVPGPRCPQATNLHQDESCLLANIQRPKLSSPSDSLPVLLFVHGGGFQSGSGLDFNPTKFIAAGQNISQPFITVTINYRLGLLGFMASSDLAELAGVDPSTGLQSNASSVNSNVKLNRGYLDIEEAIRWVSANIDSWGGDPNRLTIMGQSAGANGIVAQILAAKGSPPNQITNSTSTRQRSMQKPLKPLFQSAILQSPPLVPLVSPSYKDFQFSRVLQASNCSGSNTPQERVDCLRSLSWQEIGQVSVTETVLSSPSNRTLTNLGVFPWIPCLDGGAQFGGFYADSTSNSLAALDFADVPVIFGNNLDEGTVFAPKDFENVVIGTGTSGHPQEANATTVSSPADDSMHHNSTNLDATSSSSESDTLNSTSPTVSSSTENDVEAFTDFDSWIQSSWFVDPFSSISNLTFAELARNYPDIPAVGSPYDPVGVSKEDRFFGGADNQFKRGASIYGDLRFQSHRRLFLDATIQHAANQSSTFNSTSWGYLYAQHDPNSPPWAGVPHTSDLNCIQYVPNSRCKIMAQQFISFIYNGDPHNSTLRLPQWPTYNESSKNLMLYRSEGLSLLPDTFRQDQIDFLNSPLVLNLTAR